MQKKLLLSFMTLTVGLIQAGDNGTLRPIVLQGKNGELTKRYPVISQSPFGYSLSTSPNGNYISSEVGNSPILDASGSYPSPTALGVRVVKIDESMHADDARLETSSPYLNAPSTSPIHSVIDTEQLAEALLAHTRILKVRKEIIVAAILRTAKDVEFYQRHDKRKSVLIAQAAENVKEEQANLDLINARLSAVEEYQNLHPSSQVNYVLLCPFTGEMFASKTGKTVSQ